MKILELFMFACLPVFCTHQLNKDDVMCWYDYLLNHKLNLVSFFQLQEGVDVVHETTTDKPLKLHPTDDHDDSTLL